jgi:hypothetical protein
VPYSSLSQGTSRSCGCVQQERLKTEKIAQTHGMSGTAEYVAWQNMRRRCYDRGFTEYKRYGARGIRVCDAWRDDFEVFLADMGLKPSVGHSLERRDNHGNYEPGNCFWATAQEQANNRSTNTLVTLQGRTQTLAQWCRELGIKHHTVMTRMGKRGWPIERALLTPVRAWASQK